MDHLRAILPDPPDDNDNADSLLLGLTPRPFRRCLGDHGPESNDDCLNEDNDQNDEAKLPYDRSYSDCCPFPGGTVITIRMSIVVVVMAIIEAPDDSSEGDARCYRREGYHGVNGDAVAGLDSDHDGFWV